MKNHAHLIRPPSEFIRREYMACLERLSAARGGELTQAERDIVLSFALECCRLQREALRGAS